MKRFRKKANAAMPNSRTTLKILNTSMTVFWTSIDLLPSVSSLGPLDQLFHCFKTPFGTKDDADDLVAGLWQFHYQYHTPERAVCVAGLAAHDIVQNAQQPVGALNIMGKSAVGRFNASCGLARSFPDGIIAKSVYHFFRQVSGR